MIAESPLDWKVAVLRASGGCVAHDDPTDCERPLEAHHVIDRQKLRKINREDLFWDVRNGVGVCYRAHRRHTGAVERLRQDLIPPAAWEFADELGLRWWVERRYPA